MRRCSLSRQLTTNGLVSISNYASRPEARLLQSQGASRHGPFCLPNGQVWPVHEKVRTFYLCIAACRGACKGGVNGPTLAFSPPEFFDSAAD